MKSSVSKVVRVLCLGAATTLLCGFAPLVSADGKVRLAQSDKGGGAGARSGQGDVRAKPRIPSAPSGDGRTAPDDQGRNSRGRREGQEGPGCPFRNQPLGLIV